MRTLLATRPDQNAPPVFNITESDTLPTGNTTIAVEYSGINYKDALAVTNRAPILRSFPMVPGIDLAGTITATHDPRWQIGDHVVIAGRGIGERCSGGYSTMTCQSGDILTRLPAGLTLADAMAIGTAGITAAMSVTAIMRAGIAPSERPVLVTGASGGVGMHAIALLAQQGFTVTAVTGRPALADDLRRCGATMVIGRDEIAGDKPLERERWAAVVDTVGGPVGSAAIRTTAYGGVVTLCGHAGGAELDLTVYPLILRGIQLIGIESVNGPQAQVDAAWNFVATHWDRTRLAHMIHSIMLADVPDACVAMLNGERIGRTIVTLAQ